MNAHGGQGQNASSHSGATAKTQPLVSIAMCTYNGGAYLGDQLASFVHQTQRPDELVVCDDGSTDNTLEVLEQFGKEAPFPVKIHRNQERLGPTKNFEKAISLCGGHFIFLSDQDDVWMPDKLNTLLQALRDNSGAGYVFSDAILADEMLRPIGYSMWQSIRFTAGQRRQFQRGKQMHVLLKHNVVTGATMAFRAALKSTILPIPYQHVHDEWIASLASSVGMYGVIVEEPLIQYRQHLQQVIGGARPSLIQQASEAANNRGKPFESRLHDEELRWSQVLERLSHTGHSELDVHRLLDAKIQHLRVRRSIHEHPRYARFFAVSRECLTSRYHRFSFGCKSAARDLLL
jgi:hypothetical protein